MSQEKAKAKQNKREREASSRSSNKTAKKKSPLVDKRNCSKTTKRLKERKSHKLVCLGLASLAGVCGALSGVVGKASVTTSSVGSFLGYFGFDVEGEGRWYYATWGLRLLFLLLNIFFTAQMWRYFLKALAVGSTPVCQIISSSVNFSLSAIMGILFFEEKITLLWGYGAVCIVIGLGMVVSSVKS